MAPDPARPAPPAASDPAPGLRAFLRGGLPLGQAFWLWGILGGGVVNLFATILALALVSLAAPAWLAVLLFLAPVPWNLALLVGVWRSAARPEIGPDQAALARAAITAWVLALCLL